MMHPAFLSTATEMATTLTSRPARCRRARPQGAITFSGLTVADLTYERRLQDLVIVIEENAETGVQAGSITIADAFLHTAANQTLIPVLNFETGASVQLADVVAAMVTDAATGQNDDLEGSSSADTLQGGPGDDILRGGEGADQYVYARGDGNDEILEEGSTATRGDVDEIFLEGIDPGDVAYEMTPAGLILRITESSPGAGDGGSLLIHGLMAEGRGTYNGDDIGVGIERIVFSDGSEATLGEVTTQLLAARGTVFDDLLAGAHGSDTIEGRGGDDLLQGRAGDDTYVYSRGDGFDRITDDTFDQGDILLLQNIDPADVVLRRGFEDDLEILIAESAPGAGDNGRLTARWSAHSTGLRGIETIRFDDGTEWNRAEMVARTSNSAATPVNDDIQGSDAADTLEGQAGDDRLEGGRGDDTYVYARGDGADVIYDPWSDTDRLVISGYSREELSFDRHGLEGRDLIIRLARDGDQITILDGLLNSNGAIDEIELTDSGEVLTIPEILADLVAEQATDGDNVITGTDTADTLEGGAGSDLLSGGRGSDTYVYRAGDGDDRIVDNGYSSLDVLQLPDYSPADVEYALRAGADSDDLVLLFKEGQNRLVLEGVLANDGSHEGVERIEFGDGTVWTRADYACRGSEQRPDGELRAGDRL